MQLKYKQFHSPINEYEVNSFFENKDIKVIKIKTTTSSTSGAHHIHIFYEEIEDDEEINFGPR